jgi:hypothetical protein
MPFGRKRSRAIDSRERQLFFDESTVNFQRGRHLEPPLGRAHSSILSPLFVCEGRGSPAFVIPPRNSCSVMARVSLMILSLRHTRTYLKIADCCRSDINVE